MLAERILHSTFPARFIKTPTSCAGEATLRDENAVLHLQNFSHTFPTAYDETYVDQQNPQQISTNLTIDDE